MKKVKQHKYRFKKHSSIQSKHLISKSSQDEKQNDNIVRHSSYLPIISIIILIHCHLYSIHFAIQPKLFIDMSQEQHQVEAIQDSQREVNQEIKEPQPPQFNPDTQPQVKAQNEPERISVLKKQYKFQEKHAWNPNTFDVIKALEGLQIDKEQNEDEDQFRNDISIKVISTILCGSTINRHIGYVIKGKDKNGEFEITRRYSEFLLLRQKLLVRWPGCFIPPVPNKTLIGNSDQQLKRNRTSFFNNFFTKITWIPEVYYGEEFQAFLRSPDQEVQSKLKSFQEQNFEEILFKYKESFPEIAKNQKNEEERSKSWKEIENFENYFKQFKVDLNDYKNQFRKLTEYKTRYFQAIGKVNKVLLPEYEQILLNWFNDVQENNEDVVVEKEKQNEVKAEIKIEKEALEMSNAETQQIKDAQKGKQLRIEQEVKIQEKENKQKIEIESKDQKLVKDQKVEKVEKEKTDGIINSQGYRAKYQQTANEIVNYNGPVWHIYNILKFQLKEIDAVLQAIDQCRFIKKEQDYLNRNIKINQEQIQSLNNKKTTLKTFLMGGNQDEKKSKLTNESKAFEDKLQKIQELYAIVHGLIEKFIKEFHHERVLYYRKYLKKSLHEEIDMIERIMEFHIFELQILEKEGKSRKQKAEKVEIK